MVDLYEDKMHWVGFVVYVDGNFDLLSLEIIQINQLFIVITITIFKYGE